MAESRRTSFQPRYKYRYGAFIRHLSKLDRALSEYLDVSMVLYFRWYFLTKTFHDDQPLPREVRRFEGKEVGLD